MLHYTPRTRRLTRWLVVTIGLVGLMISSFWWWDARIHTYLEEYHLPGDVEKALQLSEAFAHGAGVFAILATLYWVDIPRRKALNVCILLTVTSGVIANGLKSIFSRVRPYADTNAIVSDNWLPFFHGSFWDATHRSFPSGHTATAVALAIGLSFVYPRGRFLFALLACMASFQRIFSRSHFPSDVFAGAAIACLCSAVILHWATRTTGSASDCGV